jgi:hypothetical protein
MTADGESTNGIPSRWNRDRPDSKQLASHEKIHQSRIVPPLDRLRACSNPCRAHEEPCTYSEHGNRSGQIQLDERLPGPTSRYQIGAKSAKGWRVSRGLCHSKCHSWQVKYSVLYSKNLNKLEPPYGIEP